MKLTCYCINLSIKLETLKTRKTELMRGEINKKNLFYFDFTVWREWIVLGKQAGKLTYILKQLLYCFTTSLSGTEINK